MKTPLIAALAVAIVALTIRAFTSQTESSHPSPPGTTGATAVPDTGSPTRNDPGDLSTLAREVPSRTPRQSNSAGHIIIATADTSDAEETDALLQSFARGEAHLNHMRRENAFVTRRQIVELPETFTQIGERMRNGEAIEKITLPDFDGKTFEMKYNPALMGPAGERNGTLLGTLENEESSDAILGYYDDATSAYINIPNKNRVLEYMTVGGNQIVVKEIDLAARNIAEPCNECLHHGGKSPHPAGAAHHVAHGIGG